MIGRYESPLEDCTIELGTIKTWIDSNKLHSNVRFLVSYAVVKSCGTIEMVLKQMLFDLLISGGANQEAKNHFTKHITNASFNPSCGQIIKLLSDVNPSYKNSFEAVIHGRIQKGDLKSLVGLRNNFSHGTSITASIDDIINYHNSGKWILEQLHTIIFPT